MKQEEGITSGALLAAASWQARAVAAEVALAKMLQEFSDIAQSKTEEVRNEFTSGEAHGWSMAYHHASAIDITPDLTAARELIRKAGEADGLRKLYDDAQDDHVADRQSLQELNMQLSKNHDALARTEVVLREALDDLRTEAGMVISDSYHFEKARKAALVALRLPLPEAVKIAAAEREKAEAWDSEQSKANRFWMAEKGSHSQALDYYHAALEAARGGTI